MKLMPPKSSAKAAQPTPKPIKRGKAPVPPKKPAPAVKLAAAKADPDMDGDAGLPEDAASEEKEPATAYAASARKSRPSVI